MEYDIHSRARLGTRRRIRQIAFDELHPFQSNKICMLAGDEAVDSAYDLTASEQGSGYRAADNTGSASASACAAAFPARASWHGQSVNSPIGATSTQMRTFLVNCCTKCCVSLNC